MGRLRLGSVGVEWRTNNRRFYRCNEGLEIWKYVLFTGSADAISTFPEDSTLTVFVSSFTSNIRAIT